MQDFHTIDPIFFDTETTGLDPWHGDAPFCFSFCNDAGKAVAWALDVDPFTRKPIVDPPNRVSSSKSRDTVTRVWELLELEPPGTIVMHHAKFDVRMMELGHGIHIRGHIEDTMYMAHACRSDKPVGLKHLAKELLGISDNDEIELKKTVLKARRIVKRLKLEWKLGYKKTPRPDGSFKIEAITAADYWLPRAVAMDKKARKELSPRERKQWKTVCARYAKQDVIRTWGLYHFFKKLLGKRNMQGAAKAYQMEMELWPTTYAMETRGVKLSLDTLNRLTKEAQLRRKASLGVVQRFAWDGFNPESSAHIRKLVEKLQLSVNERTPTGLAKVDKYFMQNHLDVPAIKALAEFKTTNKMLTSFLLQFRGFSDASAIIHPDFRQVGPRTRRFACANPNLQQTPDDATSQTLQTVEAIAVRSCFGPRKGYVWYLLDFKALEAIIFADMAQEPVMLQAFANGEDVYSTVADRAWGGKGNPRAICTAIESLELDRGAASTPVVLDAWQSLGVKMKEAKQGVIWARTAGNIAESTSHRRVIAETWLKRFKYSIVAAEASLGKKTSRFRAKQLVLLSFYGGGVRAASRNMNTTPEKAQQFIDDFDSRMPRVREFIYEQTAVGRRQGHIINAFDVRVDIDPDLAYKTVNVLIQSSAASQLKRAMIQTAAYLKETGLDAHIVMCLHDEIVFEIKKGHAGIGVIRTLQRIMEDHGGAYGIPTPVDVERTRTHWADKRKVKVLER